MFFLLLFTIPIDFMSKLEYDRKHPGAEAVLFLSIETELLHFLNFLISNRAVSPCIGIKNRLKKERLVNQVLEETIGRIQAAEAKAAAAAADAKAEAAELVRRAQQDAATALAQETAEAEARARAALAAAEADGEAARAKAGAETAAEVEALRRRAAEKEPDVVDAVLRALV